MKFKLKLFILGIYWSMTASSQCTELTSPNVNAACLTLKNLMECNLQKKKFDKALVVYLTYTHINEAYSPPPIIKNYFANLPESSMIEIQKMRVEFNGSTSTKPTSNQQQPPPRGFRSSMPEIRSTNN